MSRRDFHDPSFEFTAAYRKKSSKTLCIKVYDYISGICGWISNLLTEVLVKRAFIWCTLTKSCLRIDDARWSNVAGKPTCLIRFVLRLWARLRDVDADKQVFYGTRPWTRTSGPGKLSFGFYIVKIHIYVDVKGQLCISSNLGATAIAVWLRRPQKNTQRQKISSDLMAIPHGSRSIKLHSYYGRVIICLLSLSSCFKMLPKKCFIN